MNETLWAIVLPFIEDDITWVTLVLGVNKKLSAYLDVDPHWEEHFQMKCADIQSTLARFCLLRYVKCKYLLPTVYVPEIAKEYSVTISLNSKCKCFARQAFRQFLMVRLELDKYFPEDDVPRARFVCKKLKSNGPECKKLYCLGEIPIRIVVDTVAPLIKGNLPNLALLLEEEIEPESDDSFDCSECEEEHHSGWM